MIHTYSLSGYNIVMDIPSGAVHALSDEAYALLNRISPPMSEKCPFEGFEDAYSELYELYKDGTLFSDDDYIKSPDMSQSPVKALCLNISHDCNMRCGYCFASTGDFGTGRKLMPLEVAKAAIDFVIARSAGRRNIEIDFFGGEPLMNFEVVKQTIEYARQRAAESDKNFRFTITTNGLRLTDDIISYINENMSNVVMSLDGRREVNDSVRKTVPGGGSYEIIVPKYQKLVASRNGDYYIRGTFTAENLDFTNDVLHIAELGFSEISIEPVVSEDNSPYALKQSDLPAIFKEYEKLADIMKSRSDFNFFHFAVDLNQGPCVIKRVRGCGAGYEYVAVTPDGDIYPCHQFVGKPEYLMGNVLENTFDKKISDEFASVNVLTRPKCANCFAKFYCSGGCSAANVNMNNDISVPYEIGCELIRKRLECAIMLKVHEALK